MAHRFAPSARADVYTRITDEIVAAIEKGAGEWRMPWHHDGGSIARPRNVASDRPYRGINILALWVAATRSGYASGTWGTYRQWAERGFPVRRGETATTVVRSAGTATAKPPPTMTAKGSIRTAAMDARASSRVATFNEAQVDGQIPRELPRLPESAAMRTKT